MVALFTVTVRPAAASDVIVSPRQPQQRIDGFGASSAWTAQDMMSLRASDPDLAFSKDKGVGLSLLRVRIAPDGSCLETATALQAQLRGARVWASPWSPPAAWKSNNDVNDGGTLLPGHYDDWANTLVTFVRTMQAAGVDIIGVSAQNEPNTPPLDRSGQPIAYESCQYAPADLAVFIGNHLGPAFKVAGLQTLGGKPVQIIAPEPIGWLELSSFYTALSSNPAASSVVGAFATHEYDNGRPAAYPAITTLWETETYKRLQKNEVADPGMGSGLWVAEAIHQDLVVAGVNAWHYWWIYPRSNDNGGLWDSAGQPTKRLYVMGNYAKFVRPNFYRVAATAYPVAGVDVTAFSEHPTTDPTSGKLVIVAINANTAAVSQTFRLDGVKAANWAAAVTSDTTDMLAPAAAPTFDAISVTYSLPAGSVTTLQGDTTGAGALVVSDAGSGARAEGSASGSGLACSAAPQVSGSLPSRAAGGSAVLSLFVAVRRRATRRRTSSRNLRVRTARASVGPPPATRPRGALRLRPR